MISAADIFRALQAALPTEQHAQAELLATILADAANGILSHEEASSQITTLPDPAALIASLAGQRISTDQSVLSFGKDGQFGDVSIRDVAGRDVVQLHQTIVYQPPVALSPSTASTTSFARYLEEVQANILASFRQDTYVMLNVEPIESEDPLTLSALHQALYSAFDIQVSESMLQGGTPQGLVNAIADRRLVAILGDPGLGKTTSLRYVALQQIRALRHGQDEQIPLWVGLGRWEDQTLAAADFLWGEFCAVPNAPQFTREQFLSLLEQGCFLVLLDGLNEMPQRKFLRRGHTIGDSDNTNTITKQEFDSRENSLLALARESRSRFVLSCRISDYAHLPAWQEFKILPLSELQIREFIHHYLGRENNLLNNILETHPRLRVIMRNPYLLRNLVFLSQAHWRNIPSDRFELVEQSCLAALHREASRHNLTVPNVMDVLGKVAYDAFKRGYIGSLFHTLFDPDDNNLAAIHCAEGAGLILRIDNTAGRIRYHYQHQFIQEALALFHARTQVFKEEQYAAAYALFDIGETHSDWWRHKEAQENFERALELCPAIGTEELRAKLHLHLSKLYRLQRRAREGLSHAEAAIQVGSPGTELEFAL